MDAKYRKFTDGHGNMRMFRFVEKLRALKNWSTTPEGLKHLSMMTVWEAENGAKYEIPEEYWFVFGIKFEDSDRG